MKIALVAHTENFKDNKSHFLWLVNEFDRISLDFKKIKINWMLEEDDTTPLLCAIHGKNRGDVISSGGEFFKKVLQKRGDELGIHIHFTKFWNIDFSKSNQKRLILSAKNKFENTFGISPKSFVGGWWYSDKNTSSLLNENGFLIDASPMPLYKELRRRWFLGIPLPFRIKTCDWSEYKFREPVFQTGILMIPNALDPDVKNFDINKVLSLDLVRDNYCGCLEIYKHFVDKKFKFICIPFHPHSLKNLAIIEKFLRECDKISKIKFITLSEVYKELK